MVHFFMNKESSIIFFEFSKLDPKRGDTIKQILKESPDSSLFFRIEKNNQEFFQWALKSGFQEELHHKGPRHDSLEFQKKEMEVEETQPDSLHQTNQMFQGLIQASPLAIIVNDLDGTVRKWNPAAERLFGWREKEVIGHLLPIIPDDKKEEFLTILDAVAKGKGISGVETKRQKKEGTQIDVILWAVPISNGQGNPCVLVFLADLTKKRKMEAEILKVQTLESLGLLAGGIAHDFNNILTSLLGNISLAKLSMNSTENLRIRLDEAEKATLRATHLAQQLLTFAKRGSPLKKMTSIGELVKESAGFALRGSNVKYEFTLQSDLWTVEIDEAQISQVIHHLVFNAQQAMPSGGTVQIKVENYLLKNEKIPGLKEGPYIRISVRDFGIGISKENILKVFDPDFTTNQKGCGLRFATACSIVKSHEGVISVESVPEKGVTLLIYLPALSTELFLKEK